MRNELKHRLLKVARILLIARRLEEVSRKEVLQALKQLAKAAARMMGGAEVILGRNMQRMMPHLKSGDIPKPVIGVEVMGGGDLGAIPFMQVASPDPKAVKIGMDFIIKNAPKYGMHEEWQDDFHDGKHRRVNLVWRGKAAIH
jgi:hypothetical protein